MRRLMIATVSTVIAVALSINVVLWANPKPDKATEQTLKVEYNQSASGNVTIAVSGSWVVEGTLLHQEVNPNTWVVQVFFKGSDRVVGFLKYVHDAPSVTLSGVGLPAVSIDESGKGFTDPAGRTWAMTSKSDPLKAPEVKEGEDAIRLLVKGTTTWKKDAPENLELKEDSGRTWRYTPPKEEEAPKEEPKKKE